MADMRTQYVELLRSTQREGIENVISWLESSDFFVAPASTSFHGNYDGGLLEHSMNVAHAAIEVRNALMRIPKSQEAASSISRESILIAALLHDICKVGVYRKEKRNRKVDGRWEEYDSYGVDYSDLPLGHGEKSVIRLLRLGLALTDDEIIAIRWHMSAWDLAFQSAEAKGNIGAAKDKCPLLNVLQCADMLATAMMEQKR